MGSLASRPKAPPAISDVQPVQYVYVPPVSSVTTPAPTTPVTETPSDTDVQESARTSNLLERRRGRLGTVLTSFRGLLNDTVSGTRKTLLGE